MAASGERNAAMRLDKYLCDMGAGTRSEVKKLIAAGRVTVNGLPEKNAGRKVEERDRVALSGEEILYADYEYYMLNKPAGVISASRADLRKQEERCVVDLIDSRKRKDLFPVGRLDKDTVGLLLITNDGQLAHRLLSPKKHVGKTYYAELSRGISREDMERLSQGVDIGDEKPTLPCSLRPAEGQQEPFSRIYITICEGRFHQIKRMFAAVGSQVTRLKRLAMGPLRLDESLPEGGYRALTQTEIQALYNSLTVK